jgi:hypothetical protein
MIPQKAVTSSQRNRIGFSGMGPRNQFACSRMSEVRIGLEAMLAQYRKEVPGRPWPARSLDNELHTRSKWPVTESHAVLYHEKRQIKSGSAEESELVEKLSVGRILRQRVRENSCKGGHG